MPWKEESVMSQRLRLVEQMLLPLANITQLCDEFKISRKTAYKWLKRYHLGGINALKDQSRIPINQVNKSPDNVEKIIVETHKQFPYWGPYKLHAYLRNEKLLRDIPSHTTIGTILKRNECEVIKNNKSSPAKLRFERAEPNELWQIDFKGSFMTKRDRCYPLTILDDHSRFSIGLKACRNETSITVKSHLAVIFKEFGLPLQINADNGNPWGSADLESLTSLEIWLIKLGIQLSHSAPYHPQTNGKDERFHRSLKLEVLHLREFTNCEEAQESFDVWQHIYNFKRPHQGINNYPPGSRYRVSPRKFPDKLPKAEYGSDEVVRKVSSSTGLFRFNGKRYRAGKGLGNEYIAIKETAHAEQFAIFFMDKLIKNFKIKEAV